MSDLARAYPVGMGELKVAKVPECLEIRGLGSCIALALYDPFQRLAGLAHVVIPRPLANAPPAPAWAATEAVPRLIDALEEQGGRANRLLARMAGGSSMFPGITKGYEVGRENADVVEALLRARGIPVVSRQVGGHLSRSVRLWADTGRFDVDAIRVATARAWPGSRDPTEAARTLLESAARPLSDLLQRPVAVDESGRYDLAARDAVAFLGPRTRMRWSRLAYDTREGPEELHLVVPDLHARRIDEELRARLAEPGEEGSAIDEVLNIMLSHALTALSKMQRETFPPRSLVTRSGSTQDVLDSVGLGERDVVPVVHARMHLHGAWRGADLAVIGRGLP